MAKGAWKHPLLLIGAAALAPGCAAPMPAVDVPATLRAMSFTLAAEPAPPATSPAEPAAGLAPLRVPAIAPAPQAPGPAGAQPEPAPLPAPVTATRPGGRGGGAAAAEAPEPMPGAGPGPLELTGTVRLALGAGSGPAIAGATLTAHGDFGVLGATAGPDGAFTLALPDGRADLVVRAPGHATLCLPTWDDGPLDLHLAGALLPPVSRAAVPLAGTVVDAGGLPAAGALVMGGDGQGARFGPVVADAEGRFAGLADVPTGHGGTFALFGLQRGGRGAVLALGLAADVAIGEGAPPVAIALAAPSGQVRVAAGDGPAWTEAALAVRAPNGERVTLTRWTRAGADEVPAQFFAGLGLTVEASAASVAAAGQHMSAWRQDLAGPGDVVPALLAFPAVAAAAPAEGARLDWPAVTGAAGYRVALREPGRPAPLWEAYTPRSELIARGLPDPRPAELELSITALAGAGAGLRTLAAVGAGPRRLRWHDDAAPAGRWASTAVMLPP